MIRVQVSWLLQCYPAEGLLIFLHDRLLSTYAEHASFGDQGIQKALWLFIRFER